MGLKERNTSKKQDTKNEDVIEDTDYSLDLNSFYKWVNAVPGTDTVELLRLNSSSSVLPKWS